MAHTLSTAVAETLGPASSAMKFIKTAKQMPLAEAAYLRMHKRFAMACSSPASA